MPLNGIGCSAHLTPGNPAEIMLCADGLQMKPLRRPDMR